MTEAFSLIRWAILFTVVDINIGRFDILPAFAAYIMYLNCLEQMKEEYPELLRLKGFCIFLTIIHLIYWITDFNFPLLSLIMTIIELYVTYTILSAMADYGIQMDIPGAADLKKYKNMLVIFRVILFAFMSYLVDIRILMVLFWILYMLLFICIWACLSDMKNHQGI